MTAIDVDEFKADDGGWNIYPDTYSIRHIGLSRYIDAYRVYPQPRSPEIAAHAQGIAWKLQGANPLATVLVVVSLNLLDPVLDADELLRSDRDDRGPGRWALREERLPALDAFDPDRAAHEH